jgi:hypothetical protein
MNTSIGLLSGLATLVFLYYFYRDKVAEKIYPLQFEEDETKIKSII